MYFKSLKKFSIIKEKGEDVTAFTPHFSKKKLYVGSKWIPPIFARLKVQINLILHIVI